MMNKITVVLLVLLLLFVGGFGYYTYAFNQQVSLLREELNIARSEQAAQAQATSNVLAGLKSELETGLDNLDTEIEQNRVQTVDLGEKVGAGLDTMEQRVNSNSANIDGLRQELSQTTRIAGEVMNAPNLYRKVIQSVVRISTGQRTIASGFLYSSEGYVLTAHHVIEGLNDIYVVFPNGKLFSGSVVGSNAVSDVAVLKVNGISGVEPPKIADSSNAQIGDPVASIGNPFDLPESLNTGIISQVNRFTDIEYDGQTRFVANLLQFDAAVNFGNSGGPLFNPDGDVIGLVIARVGPDEGDGVYYAVSSNKMKRVADSIIAQGYFDYPWLGVDISDLTPQQVQAMGLDSINGALVNRVVAGGPARSAGVLVDDVVVAIDGVETRNVSELTSYLGEYKNPGDLLTLTVIRDTTLMDISLEVGVR